MSNIPAIFLEGEELQQKTVLTVSAQASDVDEVILYVTKPGEEGMANPAIQLTNHQARTLADQLKQQADLAHD